MLFFERKKLLIKNLIKKILFIKIPNYEKKAKSISEFSE